MNIRPVRLQLCPLEGREVPAGVAYPAATFDDITSGLPVHWTDYSLNNGQNRVAVAKGRDGGNALVLSGASNAVTRVWDDRASAANVRVQAQVMLNSLIPTQIFARGAQLDGTRPSYYAASVTRGANIALSAVVNGVSTQLGTIKSNQYLSNQWVELSFTVQNDRLQVRLQRLDNGQWLNRFGEWQTMATEALNAKDKSITARGKVGIERPASSQGEVTVDNFRSSAARGDITPPVVSVVLPQNSAQPNTDSSGMLRISTKIRDQSAIRRADFLIDGLLVARREKGPFRIDLDTRNFSNGPHTLSVRVWDTAGNTSITSLTVTFANATPPALADIPRHYSHIRYASLAYNGTPMDATTSSLLQSSVDLVVPNTRYLGQINSVAADTPQLIYSNVSNLYLDLLTDWLAFADKRKLSRENAFYHVTQATAFSGNSPSSIAVDRFWNVQTGNTNLTSLTVAAQQTKPSDMPLGGAGDSLYLGYPEKFRELNITVGKAPGAAWKGVWEYASAVDATGKPIAWKTLKLVSDATKGLQQGGRITFDPPAGWKAGNIAGSSANLFHVRFRTTKGSASDAPALTTIRGRDYVNANGGFSGTIPAFDARADRNGDGYLSDAEYAKRRPGMDARFRHETRLFYPGYGQMRFATNPGGAGVADWTTDYHLRMLQALPLADGIMMDNSLGRLPNLQASIAEQTDTYTYDFTAMLGQMSRAIYPRRIVANTAGGGVTAASLVDQQVAGSIEEFALRPMESTWSQFRSTASDIGRRLASLDAGKFLVLDTYSNGGGSPTDPRTRMSALAYYYLLADPNSTYLMTWGGEEPNSSWDRHWFAAIARDVGKPTSSWMQTASGTDPSDSRLGYQVFGRSYENALALYKPRSYTAGVGTGGIGDATSTTHQLDGNYRVLNSDGTLGPVTNTITLKNGEGVVLIRS